MREWVKKADEAALAGRAAVTTVASMADELARLRRENGDSVTMYRFTG